DSLWSFCPDKIGTKAWFGPFAFGLLSTMPGHPSRALSRADTRPSPSPTLMTEARRILRLQPYSMHTERAHVEWMVRFVWVHAMRSRDDLFPAALKSAAFLTDLALNGNGAAATQHQAMHALVFLSTHVLHQALEDRMNAVRADKTITVPVVITRD